MLIFRKSKSKKKLVCIYMKLIVVVVLKVEDGDGTYEGYIRDFKFVYVICFLKNKRNLYYNCLIFNVF